MDQTHFGFHVPPAPTLPALSVRQPWAWAIMAGLKRYENRSWQTAYRGPLVIHAARSRLDLTGDRSWIPGLPPEDRLDFGALVGLVDLVDIRPASKCPDDPFVSGPLCWIMEDPRPISPVPYVGQLHLFRVPAGLVLPAP